MVVGAGLLLAACTATGGGGNPANSPSPSPAVLDGRTFLSTSVTGHDLVSGSTVRLSFDAGQLGASAGCNQMGGAYQVVDGRLRIGSMMTTDMGCAAPLMAQDTWVGSFLGGATVALAGDTLTLTNGDTTMTLTDREVADPDRPLEGTRWVLDGFITGDAVSSVAAGVNAAVTIADGRMDVEAGCNTGGATVSSTASTLSIGPMALTKMACPPDAMAVEQAMTSVLSGDVGYTIEADVLTMTAGPNGLTFRAAT